MTPPAATNGQHWTAPIIRADGIPAELTLLPQWVCWRRVTRDGKVTKVPFRADLPEAEASTTDRSTWCTLGSALAAAAEPDNHLDGVGFVFTKDDPYVGIDLDNALVKGGVAIHQWAFDVLGKVPGYCEVTPSGRGLHLITRGECPGGKGRKRSVPDSEGGAIECYDRGRYFTFTGRVFEKRRAIVPCPDFAAVHAGLFPARAALPRIEPRPVASFDDAELIRRARAAKNGPKFSAVFDGLDGDKNEQDLSLCSHLAFWTGGDPEAIDRIFRLSPICDSKWTEREDYRALTIDRALARKDTYDPGYRSAPAQAAPAPPEEPIIDENGDDLTTRDATVADLRRTLSAEAWLWPGWIPSGALTLVAAEGGTGKTRFCFDLHRRMYNGFSWPDGQAMPMVDEPRVLWVVADNQHREMCDIPEAFGLPDDAVVLNAMASDPYDGTSLQTAEELADFELRIARIKPAFVVIDTITNTSDAKAQDSSDAKKQYKPLQEIATRCQVPILCVTHLNAGGKVLGRRAVEKVRVVIQLEQPDPEGQPHRRKLWVSKSKAIKPGALGVTMGDGGNEYDHSPPEKPEDGRVDGHKRGPVPARLRECMDWLSTQVNGVPVLVTHIRNAAEAKGYSVDVLYKAKSQLGIVESFSTPAGDRGKQYKQWAAPPDPEDD